MFFYLTNYIVFNVTPKNHLICCVIFALCINTQQECFFWLKGDVALDKHKQKKELFYSELLGNMWRALQSFTRRKIKQTKASEQQSGFLPPSVVFKVLLVCMYLCASEASHRSQVTLWTSSRWTAEIFYGSVVAASAHRLSENARCLLECCRKNTAESCLLITVIQGSVFGDENKH